MPRYEIVAHVVWDHDCGTAEEAAAAVRKRLLAAPGGAVELHHLAVWRHDPSPAASPLPPTARRQLVDFFAALERCAAAAEEAFRGRVEAILAGTPAATGAGSGGVPGAAPAQRRPPD